MKDFRPQKMVGWYEVKQLSGTAIRAILSSIFGSYADKRESLAALCPPEVYDNYADSDELWFDYISDTGDGFNSTFTMDTLISENELDVNGNKLPRGRFVVFGGDQVYPTATKVEYENRFIGPLIAASMHAAKDTVTDLYAIPGNHDWYDGLNNFVKIYCHKKRMGGFQTVQNRSYFAIKLKDNAWLWATDVQLESNLDPKQKEYFNWVATTHMKKGDHVILCTAEPTWVYNTQRKDDTTHRNLENFETDCINKNGLNLALIMAGDLHHYARYTQERDGYQPRHKITAGGGGAFLHPTHNLPTKLTHMHDGDFELKETFPKRKTSFNLTFKNLIFPWKNPGFGLFLAIMHLIMAYSLYHTSYLDDEPGTIFETFGSTSSIMDQAIWTRLLQTFAHSPVSILVLILFIAGFWAFCDGRSSKYKLANFAGVTHGLLHVVLMISSLSFFSWLNASVLDMEMGIQRAITISLEVFLVGGMISGVLVGIYLLISSLVFKMHDNEAFSSLKEEGYKNFLRMQLKGDKLTVYPLGITKVPKWRRHGGVFKSKHEPKMHLIDEPIEVDLS